MKDINEIMGYVVVFGLIAAFSIFAFFFVKNLFSEEMITPIVDTFNESVKTIDNASIEFMYATRDEVRNFDFRVDTIFLIVWVAFLAIITISSWYLPPLPTWNFFTYLFLGLLVVFFVFNFVGQIYDWVVTAFVYNIFDEAMVQSTVLLFYTENQPIIVLMTCLWVLGINQASRLQRDKVESSDDLIIE